jgi:Cu/Ag efflux protein CusF
MKSGLWLFAVVVVLATVVACARKEEAPAMAAGGEETPATPAASAEKTYPLRGKVVSVNAAENKITVDHERVEGLWEPMKMDFEVLGSLPPEGSTIRATLHVDNGRYWLTDITVE